MNSFSPKKLNRRNALSLMATSSLGCLCGCRSTPVTGRRQLMLIPEGKELTLGIQAYEESLSQAAPSSNQRLVDMVNRVGQRIAAVSNRDDFQWQFTLIGDATQNAFCLPGGKVAIHEGILDVCQNEGGLAVVMSHEIAHALARHGGERMSHNLAVDGARGIVDKIAGHYVPDKKALLMQAYGVGSRYGVLLPYSRRQESEADHIGLMLMARAGYDPGAAPPFWNRFGDLKAEGQPSEFMSTHPSDDRRAADLRALMGDALAIYQRAASKYGSGESVAG